MIVVFILGTMTGLLSIRIEGALSGGDLRLASRMIIGEINGLRGRAVASHREQALRLNVDENTLYSEETAPSEDSSTVFEGGEGAPSAQKGRQLPEGVDLEDVFLFFEGKIQEGEALIRFYANGCVDRSLIHLRNEHNDVYTLEVNPLTGRVELHDTYVEQSLAE